MRNRYIVALCLGALAILICGFSPVQAMAGEYAFVSVDYSGASATLLSGINSAGQVVGCFREALPLDYFNSFLMDPDGTITPIEPAGAYSTQVNAINDAGLIVGSYYHESGGCYGFVRSVDGVITSFSYPGAVITSANGINDAGQIVGTWVDTSGAIHSFLRNTDGSFAAIDDLPGVEDTVVLGINDDGLMAGFYIASGTAHAVLWSTSGTVVGIEPPGADVSYAYCINDLDQVVGEYRTLSGARGFMRSAGGNITPIDYPGADVTGALGINEAGQVVGYYLDASGKAHGYIATPVSSPEQDIDDLIEAVDQAVADKALSGTGPGSSATGKLGAFKNMLASAEASITAGDYAGALDQLKAAYAKCDGDPLPPDMVAGPAREAIAAEILKLIGKLEAMMP